MNKTDVIKSRIQNAMSKKSKIKSYQRRRKHTKLCPGGLEREYCQGCDEILVYENGVKRCRRLLK